MSNPKLQLPANHDDARDMLNGRKRMRIGHNTYMLINPVNRVVTIEYHGSVIARLTRDNELSLTLAGYPTATTRTRLHLIMVAFDLAKDYAICQRNHRQMLWNKTDDTYTEIGSMDAVIFQHGKLQSIYVY